MEKVLFKATFREIPGLLHITIKMPDYVKTCPVTRLP